MSSASNCWLLTTLGYSAKYFKVSFSTHTGNSHVGSDMGNGDGFRTCLDHERAVDTRLGHKDGKAKCTREEDCGTEAGYWVLDP
jgi:hypothetical protein